MFSSAKSRHIVTVCKSLTEADKVSLDAVIMVAALKVKTEACSYIVKDKNYAVIVTPFTHAIPIFLICGNIVVEITVVVRLSDKTCDVAVVFVIELL